MTKCINLSDFIIVDIQYFNPCAGICSDKVGENLHSLAENYFTMTNIIVSGITIDDLVEKVAAASSSKLLENVERLINQRLLPKDGNKEITRKEVSLLLDLSPPTIDKYTEEGLLKKYGFGRRARYLLHEVEAARPSIMESLYRKEKPLHRRLQSNRQK